MAKIKCPINKEFFETHYIKFNKTIKDIENEFGYSHTTIYNRLKKLGLNKNKSETKRGYKNPQWKGDNAKYGALHDWIRRNKPKPKFCEKCGKDKPFDLSNISGKYKRDINDFKYICRRCHMEEDGRRKRLIKRMKNRKKTNCYTKSLQYRKYQAQKQREWYAKPENKKKLKIYRQKPEVKKRTKIYQRKYQKEHPERMRELKRNWATKNRRTK